METKKSNLHTKTLHPTTVFRAEYATSLDERGHLPVFEYEINGQAIMWDRETREVFLTGIWKALGHRKVDVIKTVQANPRLKTKRMRGGLLKIQGTWVPYKDARSLCLRAAWTIRQHLIPIFGTGIVEDCLPPGHPNYRVVCLDYLQLKPEYFRKHPLLTRKRQYIIKAPSTTSSQHISSSFPPSPPSPPPPLATTSSPYISPSQSSSSSSSSLSPMALSHILNNDDIDPEDIGDGDHDTMTDDGVVPDDDGGDIAGLGTSPTLAFQVVPVSCAPLDDPPPSLISSPSANDWPTLNGIASPLFDDLAGTSIWATNDIQDSIETIQATIILQGLSHQDKLAIRQTVPDKVTMNGREFSVLWD